MIETFLRRLMERISPRSDEEIQYMDMHSSLDLIAGSSGRARADRAVCSTAMLCHAVTCYRNLGADKQMVMDFVEYVLDESDGCDISRAEKVWQQLGRNPGIMPDTKGNTNGD